MPVTIHDVAAGAGVSISTVSRVLGNANAPLVSESTRQRVIAVATELGYHPNPAARALVTGKTLAIAYVNRAPGRPFYAQHGSVLQKITSEHGYHLLILPNESWVKSDHAWRSLRSVDGIIAHHLQDIPGHLSRWVEVSQVAPLVMVGGPSDMVPKADSVRCDLAPAVMDALGHLWNQGCRRIAHMSDMLAGKGPYGVRADNYLKFVHGVGQQPLLIPVAESHSRGVAREAMQRYLSTHDPPDAVFCHNDDQAIGAYRALLDAGLRIPQDVALVGCDGIEDAEYLEPPLSTIVQPALEIMERAWDLLQARMANPSKPPQSCRLCVRFVARGSTLGRRT